MEKLDHRLWEFLGWLEIEHGYDPIGASDMRADISMWLRLNPEIVQFNNEMLLKEWESSPQYARYFPDGN